MHDYEKDCLHCQINKLVGSHLLARRDDEPVDATDMVAKMADSLAELILFSMPQELHGKTLAHAISKLGAVILEKGLQRQEDTTH